MVFLMANGCATRVQRICKKLQTVLEEGVFCWAVKGYFQRLAAAGRWCRLDVGEGYFGCGVECVSVEG